MDVHTMLRTAIVLLGLTGAGGLLMAGIRFNGKPHPPSWLAMLHGLLAAGGLTLLLYAGIAAQMPALAWFGLGLLLLAAMGGMVLNLRYHWKDRELAAWLVLVHAAVAVTGLVNLVLGAW